MSEILRFIDNNYLYMVTGITIVLCVLVFLFIQRYMYGAIRSTYQRAKLQLVNAMQHNKSHSALSYNYQAQRLNKLGVTYYTRGKVTPLVYLTYKIAALTAGFIIGMMFNFPLGIVLAFIGYIIPDKLIEQRNKDDNKKMLSSVMNIYDIMLLQINSGEYITHVLIDAYRVTTHPRLKAALMELTGDIASTNNLVLSMEMFDSKFDNDNIHNLVVLVRQLSDTGSVAGLLSDIKKRLDKLQESYNSSERTRINRLIAVSTAVIAFAAIAVLGYAFVLGIADSAKLLTR